MDKKNRRAAAIKRDKRKKLIITSICVAVAVIVVTLVIYDQLNRNRERVYTDGNQTVTLQTNGAFTASLAHNSISGTYKQKKSNGVTIISFTSDGATVNGSITDNILSIPEEWDDHHGHGSTFKLIE